MIYTLVLQNSENSIYQNFSGILPIKFDIMSSVPAETSQSQQNGAIKQSCLPSPDAKILPPPVSIPATSREIPNSILAPSKELKDPAPALPCNVKKPIYGTTKSVSTTEPNNLHVFQNPTNEVTKSQIETSKVDEPPVKVVNPLRLARPLEAAKAGLSRTSFPPTRPMPLPTVSPLCPPGSVGKSTGKPAGPGFIKSGNSKMTGAMSVPGKEKLNDKKGKTEDSEDKKDESVGIPSMSIADGSDFNAHEMEKNKQVENTTKSIKPEINIGPRSTDTPVISRIEKTDAFTRDEDTIHKKKQTEVELEKNEQIESIPKSIASKESSEATLELVGKPPSSISIKKLNTLKEGSTHMPSCQKEDKPGKDMNELKEKENNKLEDVGVELESDYPHYYDSIIPNVPGKRPDFWFPLVLNQIPKEPIPTKQSDPLPMIRVKNMDSLLSPAMKKRPLPKINVDNSLKSTKIKNGNHKNEKIEKPDPLHHKNEGIDTSNQTATVSEKEITQKKRKLKQPPSLPEKDNQKSKRPRIQVSTFKSPDPEMEQILKAIQKQQKQQEEDVSSGLHKISPLSKKKQTNKSSKTGEIEANKTDEKLLDTEPEKDVENDEPISVRRARNKEKKVKKQAYVKKEKPTKKVKSTPKPVDFIFFKHEYLAVRNVDGGFYICRAEQNIKKGSHKIKILWLSNEPTVIKENPNGEVYGEDFYDTTDFETILTSVEMEKVKGKRHLYRLNPEEKNRVNNILRKSKDKSDGKLDESTLLFTEDNPDGLDISLYTGEDQLDEIEKIRKKKKHDEKKISKGSRGRKHKVKATSDLKLKITTVEKKSTSASKSTKNWFVKKSKKKDEFEFEESDEEEVMPIPKKRKLDGARYLAVGNQTAKELSTSTKVADTESEIKNKGITKKLEIDARDNKIFDKEK